MSPLGSTSIWRGMASPVAKAVTLKPAGADGFSFPQPAGVAIFIGGSNVWR